MDHPIVFSNVEKYFYLQHQKTLKELIQAMFTRSKTLERVHALKKVSFSIKKGESVGIIGRNGAGKSTVLKLMAGVSSATKGTVEVHGRVAPLIELGAGFHPQLTGRENVYLNGVILGLKESFIASKFDEIVDFAEIKDFIDVPVKYYSSGMYMRLAFAVSVFVDPDILLIDEILSVGDVAFQKKCITKMREFKKREITIIFVSHDLNTISDFCDKVIYIKDGEIAFEGDTKKGIEHYTQDISK